MLTATDCKCGIKGEASNKNSQFKGERDGTYATYQTVKQVSPISYSDGF